MTRLHDLKIYLKAHFWLIPVLVLIVGLFFWTLAPAPPTHLTLVTGPEGGGYHAFGQHLKARLAEAGIELELVGTAGSLDNLKRLLDKNHPVQIGLVQSGTEQHLAPEERQQLRGLGALYQEPLWLFQCRGLDIRDLAELRGKRIGIGSDGSGTQAVVTSLFAANGLVREPGWQALTSRQASIALSDGSLEAAFFVGPPENPLIQELARNPGLWLADLRRAAAYQAHFPFLKALLLPEGLLDLAHNSPDRPLTTLSSMATLVANHSLHPALTPLVLESSRQILQHGSLIDPPNSFPRAEPSGFALTKEADSYYRTGLPYLQRFMPFRIASLVDRYIVLLIPFLAILLPLGKMISPLYEWRMHSRTYKWYRHLHEIDAQIHDGSIRGHEQKEIARLHEIEKALGRVELPLSYSHELYALHLHVHYMIERLRGLAREERVPRKTPRQP
ncbi:TRAP transporter solute receptor, TAXI family [Azotobacter beijerinckii]|uniref:TRAP transporter solute receptor, TAXI family n=1 Tax=Azotobacter beijerinckii TaxID=170623 RepID=A0A1H6Z6J0_9GAMM|nr:TAXI family TRAP transporter solute-binding subunit [Azotobacter beijerinckii]SEJ49079.1 TRAP transporter solute receptor, TAXI family [Azotobacter beijerinckii]SEJ61452.1 TRAP transporter solute receptor, TAXI family [Azotobacter beijerinckii]SER77550.1 TRAP transporter solute receptor, TAXI family [Azotobacter beijerinckii]